MNTVTINDVKIIGDQVLEILSQLTETQLNKIPFEDSWTAGQVGEHILKYSSGVVEVLNGKTVATERDPEEKVAQLEKIFLDFSTKMKSPAEIVPSDKKKHKERLLHSLSHAFDGIEKVGATEDLEVTCIPAEIPGLGTLTRTEWIVFFKVHTRRHIHQLEKIVAAL